MIKIRDESLIHFLRTKSMHEFMLICEECLSIAPLRNPKQSETIHGMSLKMECIISFVFGRCILLFGWIRAYWNYDGLFSITAGAYNCVCRTVIYNSAGIPAMESSGMWLLQILFTGRNNANGRLEIFFNYSFHVVL